MTEIYWITRLEAINVLFGFMIAIPIIILIINFFTNLVENRSVIGWRKCRVALFIIGVLGATFVPTKSDMLLILGVGTTIDYVQSNDTINKLPDKCVDALNAWVDSLSDDNNNNK